MSSRRDELRDELMALLAAGDELSGDTHEQLVECFLARIETEGLDARRPNRLQRLYDELVPVGLPAVAGIVVAHGLTLLIIGKWMLEGVMSLSPFDSVYWPAWTMLGVIWVVEVLITLATISLLTHRTEKRPVSQSRRSREFGT
jgi:hypothetical protein